MLYVWIGLGICAGVVLTVLFVWFNNSCLKITRYKVADKSCRSAVRIVHLSDLHGKTFGKRNVKLIEKVMREKPDIIAVTGDIIHKYTPKNKKVALEAVSDLSKIAPVFFVSGNHELRGLQYRVFKSELIEAGARVLDDCCADICGITLVGLKCSSQKNGAIEKVMPAGEGAKVLLFHKPHFAYMYAGYGYALALCGHAHGGQWRIPFTGIGVFSPGQGMFPKLTSGLHNIDGLKTVISRGLGNSECPLRLFNRPEIVVAELLPETDAEAER